MPHNTELFFAQFINVPEKKSLARAMETNHTFHRDNRAKKL